MSVKNIDCSNKLRKLIYLLFLDILNVSLCMQYIEMFKTYEIRSQLKESKVAKFA